MAKGKKTGGRQKGTPNHLTTNARAAFRDAFDAIGGAAKLADWASKNLTDFYRIFARLIPVDVHVEQRDITSHYNEDDMAILERLGRQHAANQVTQKTRKPKPL